MQTKKCSFIEVTLNICSGMIIAFCISQLAHIFEHEIQQYIYKGFEWNISASSNMIMTVVLTFVSVLRSYAWRRYFNSKIKTLYKEKSNETTKN